MRWGEGVERRGLLEVNDRLLTDDIYILNSTLILLTDDYIKIKKGVGNSTPRLYI